MKNCIRILILEPNPDDLELIQHALTDSGLQFEAEIVQTKELFEISLLKFQPEIILADFSLPSLEGFSAFRFKQRMNPEIPFIIVSGAIGDENAVDLIKSGVTDYVLKNNLYQIGPKIVRALNEAQAEKKKEIAEASLKHQGEQLQNILNLSLDVIFTVDQHGHFVTLSPAAKLIFDYEPEELIGRNLLDLIYEDDKEKTYYALADLQYGIDIINLESRFVRKSGNAITILWSARWHTDETGYGIAKEITEIKKAKEKLTRSAKRFKTLLQNSTDGLTLIAEDGSVIERSGAALKILGLTSEEATSTFRLDLVHPDDLPVALYAFELVKNDPDVIKIAEYRMRMLDGTYKWIETTFQNQLAEPAVNAIVLNFRDINERKKSELKLKKNDLIFNKAQSISLLGSWHVDMDTGQVFWSDEIFRIFGLMPGEVEPSLEMYFSFVHPEDLPFVKQAMENMESKQEEASFPLRIIRKDGEIRHLFSDSKFEFDPETKDKMLFGVIIDITNQKISKKQLKHSEARLKQAQIIGRIGNWETNYQNGSYECSDEIYRILGLEKDKISINPKMFFSFVHPDERALLISKVKSTQHTLENGSVYFRFFRANGELRYGYAEWRYDIDKNGNATSVFGILQDITDKKKSELALKESEVKYRNLFHLSPLPMWVFDPETYRFLDVNEAAIRHYGYSLDEFLNMTIKEIRPQEDIAIMESIVLSNKLTNGPFQGIVNHKKKNGEIIQVNLQSNDLELGSMKARLILATDISERIRHVQAIEEQNTKLREIAWLQSHVVRAPLARMLGLISLIKTNYIEGANTNELMNYLLTSANELDKVIRDIVKETDNI